MDHASDKRTHPPIGLSSPQEEEPDQDLFLSTSREKQPGETSFDLTSQTWAGVDEIVFSEEEAGEAWCTDCLVGGGCVVVCRCRVLRCTICLHITYTISNKPKQVYLSVYGYAGDVGQYTLRVETGVSELQSAVRALSFVF